MTTLFVLAHPDDEAFGPAGTIAKCAKDGDVVVYSMCNGSRPGSEHVATARQAAFKRSCALLGATPVMDDNNDLTLGYTDVMKAVMEVVQKFKPTVVYTHNISDINIDHRMVAEASMVACRPHPTSSVKELYFCEVLSSTSWSFGQIQPVFEPNVYVDVSEYMSKKIGALAMYKTELRDAPDARSSDAMIALATYRGCQVGVLEAEAFKQVFVVR